MNRQRPALAFALVLAFVSNVFAEDRLDTFKTLKGSEVSFSLPAGYFNATLSISGPNGFYAQVFSRSGSPSLDLIRLGGTADGLYNYELTAASPDTARIGISTMKKIGMRGEVYRNIGVRASGSFHANGGLIVQQADQAEFR